MAKPRKKTKATTTPRKLKGRVPAKRSPSQRKGHGAAAPADDTTVFIPVRVEQAHTSVRGALRQPDGDEHGGDVFVAMPGEAVIISHAQHNKRYPLEGPSPLGISNDEYFASLEPRAFTPGGWTTAELHDHGLEVKRGAAICRYGCGGGASNVPGVSGHMNECEYWNREGKNRTPFD